MKIVKKDIQDFKKMGDKEQLKIAQKTMRELKDEIKKAEKTNETMETIYKADRIEAGLQRKLDTINEQIKLKANEIEAYNTANKIEAIKALKKSYAEQRESIRNRIAEINKDLNRIRKGRYKDKKVASKYKKSKPEPPKETPPVVEGQEPKIKTEKEVIGEKSKKETVTKEKVKTTAKIEPEEKATSGELNQGALFETAEYAPEIKQAMKEVKINELGPFKKLVLGIRKKNFSLPGIYKKLQEINIAQYLAKKINPGKIPGLIGNPLQFFRAINAPELAIIADGIEKAGGRMLWKTHEYVKKLERYVKNKAKMSPETFFERYEKGIYDKIIEQYNKGKLDLKKLTPDEIAAIRVKQFTDLFADTFQLKERIGPHGKPLYRKRYLPHILLSKISEKIKEKKALTADEMALFNEITGRKFKNVHEIPRYLNLPHLKDPFVALEYYGELATKKIMHDTHSKIFSETKRAMEALKDEAAIDLKALRESEKKIKEKLSEADRKGEPEKVKYFESQLAEIRKRLQTDKSINVRGYDNVIKNLDDILEKVLEQSTKEDKAFFNALNSKNPLAVILLKGYLKNPIGGKPIDLIKPTVVETPNGIKIKGFIKEDGKLKPVEYTPQEYFGKRVTTKMLSNYKAMNYASILGGSIQSTITNLTQTLNFIAQLPGNKYFPILPSVNSIRAVLGGFYDTLKSIADPRLRKKYQRSDIFLSLDRLYDGVRFNETFLGNIMDKILINMKISEIFNRALTFNIARRALKMKNGKLTAAQKITPAEIDMLAGEISDAINFKYTPLHTEKLLSSNLGKLGFHFGSYFVKQVKLLSGMWKKEWRDPAVQRFYNAMKRGEAPKSILNKMNNSGRMAVMRWIVLTTGLMTAGKGLFDVWLWQVDPRRQLFYNPLDNPLVKAPFNLLAGTMDLLPHPYGNPERGIKKIQKVVGGFTPMMSQIRRIHKAAETGDIKKAIFSSLAEKEAPEIQ